MPTIRSIEVNHNIGSDVNASTLEKCNFQKKVQTITLSNSAFKFGSQRDELEISDPTCKTKTIIMIACIFNGIGVH